jgi:2-keto-4-pentenoate hydratase
VRRVGKKGQDEPTEHPYNEGEKDGISRHLKDVTKPGHDQGVENGIDHVINAVEFAQDMALATQGNPETKTINHTLAAGMGHAGVIVGSGRAEIGEIQLNSETARCVIDGQEVAAGSGSNIYGGPLNALYSLVNMLPEYGKYLKEGDIVITGSVYDNPTIDSRSDVRVEFSSLGTINFRMR